MRDTQMPWPAIDFAKLPGKEALQKYARRRHSLPCGLLDASGKVISQHIRREGLRLGPEKVVADLEAIFAKASAPGIAATR